MEQNSMRNGHRKHVCTVCCKTYAKAEHLIRHERTHTGDKPFACLWCHRKFSRQDSLARHQQRQGHDGLPPLTLPDVQTNTNPQQAETIYSELSSTIVEGGDQSTLGTIPVNFLDQTTSDAAQLQTLGNVIQPDPSDDFFMQLTWPDSEELLQTILTSTLAPWSQNVEALPTQYLLNEATPNRSQDNDSPWLSQNTTTHQAENGSHAVRNISQIISELSANVTSEAESAVLSTVFLDACLHMFFDQFIPTFPICHRPTFVFRDCTHPLLINSIALGSLFTGQEVNIAKGEVLWKLAHTAVATSWHSLISHRGPYDSCPGIQLILTALLGQTYAMLSGTARLRSTAQIFHSLGFYWARQCDMFNFRRRFNPIDIIDASSRDAKHELWKSWAAEELCLRALLGHYILDGQLPYFTGAPTCQRHASNPLPLPCSEALFEASTLDEWISKLGQENFETTTFRHLLLALFEGSPDAFKPPSPLSVLSIHVIMEGLESFVSDANSIEGVVVGSPTNIAISRALGSLYAYITNARHLSHGDKVELSLRWHIICVDAAVNFHHVCRALCSQFSVDQNVFGKLKQDEQYVDLKKWTESARARIALIHAVAVRDTLAQLPVGKAHAIHLPITIFAAATMYIAFVLVGNNGMTIPNVMNWQHLMSIDLDDRNSIQHCGDDRLEKYFLNPFSANEGQTKNLLYDCNVFLIRLRQIKRPWGICGALESILEQWLSKCGI